MSDGNVSSEFYDQTVSKVATSWARCLAQELPKELEVTPEQVDAVFKSVLGLSIKDAVSMTTAHLGCLIEEDADGVQKAA